MRHFPESYPKEGYFNPNTANPDITISAKVMLLRRMQVSGILRNSLCMVFNKVAAERLAGVVGWLTNEIFVK